MKLDPTDQRKLNKYIERAIAHNRNLRPAFIYAVSVVADSTIENFRLQGSQEHPWRPLAESTIEARTKKGTWPGNILEEYGFLKQSLLPVVRVQGSFRRILRESAEYGTILKKAPALQFGRPEINLPPRPFLFWKNEDVRRIMSFMFVWSFYPGVAAKYGNAPTKGRIPESLFMGFGSNF